MRSFFAGFSALILLTAWAPLSGQVYPKIDFGSILRAEFKDTGEGRSPLVINGGDRSFFANWHLFLTAEITDDLSFYSTIQTDNDLRFVSLGMSAIYRPRHSRAVQLEVGRFLVPFGTFLRRRWASENPLIEFPIFYIYNTGLIPTDFPESPEELLRVRGDGRNIIYPHDLESALAKRTSLSPNHRTSPTTGLRIIAREVYLPGAQLFGEYGRFRYNLGVTNGSLSNPGQVNTSNGLQLLGRLSHRPAMGLELGGSLAWGSYLDKDAVVAKLAQTGQAVEDLKQTALGLDLGYSVGHLVLFSEAVFNRWPSPFIAEDLKTVGYFVEAKYTLFPRFFLAGRYSALDFKDIDDVSDVDNDSRLRESWDYDVYQLEFGLGYHINRNSIFKAVTRISRTKDALGDDPEDDLVALQISAFF